MKNLILAVSLVVSFLAFGSDIKLDWVASETPGSMSDGKVVLTYSEDRIATLTAVVDEGERIVFSGDGMAFAASAEIKIEGHGGLAFSNAVEAAGRLCVSGDAPDLYYPDSHPANSAALLIFPGVRNLEDYEPISAYLQNYTSYGAAPAYFLERDEGWIDVQFHQRTGDYSTGVHVRFWQTEEGIVATNICGASAKDYGASVGTDMRINNWGGSQYNYSYRRLTLRGIRKPEWRRVEFCGGLQSVTELVSGAAVNVVHNGPVEAGTASTALTFANGAFVWRDPSEFTYAGTVVGSNGTMGVELSDGPEWPAWTADDCIGRYEGDLPTTDTLLLENTSLLAITNVRAAVGWRQLAKPLYCGLMDAQVVRNNGKVAIVRIFSSRNADNTMAQCAALQLTQIGDDIYAKKLGGYYAWVTKWITVDDFDTPEECDRFFASWNVTAAGTTKTTEHGITNLVLQLSGPTGVCECVSVTLAGVNTTRDSVYEFRGGRGRRLIVTSTVTTEYPQQSGTLNVRSGADLHFALGRDAFFGVNSNSYGSYRFSRNVFTGGWIFIDAEKCDHVTAPVNICGGTYAFAASSVDWLKDLNFINDFVSRVTYTDGGRSYGEDMRLGCKGYGDNLAILTVNGSKPSCCDHGWLATGGDTADVVLTNVFDIADVTGGPEADFILSGGLRSTGYCRFVKQGAGTLRAKSRISNPNGPLELAEGVLSLAADSVLADDLAVQFNGGTLAVEGSVSNALATASLSSDSTIALAAGAKLVIGDSSAAEWAADAVLDITSPSAEPDGSVVFDWTNPLTPAQQRQVRWNGKRVRFDDQGGLSIPGMIIIFR